MRPFTEEDILEELLKVSFPGYQYSTSFIISTRYSSRWDIMKKAVESVSREPQLHAIKKEEALKPLSIKLEEVNDCGEIKIIYKVVGTVRYSL